MMTTNTTNGGTIAAKLPKNAPRRERWHYHVCERLAEIAANYPSGCYFPGELIEQAEGRPLADIITSRLCWERGLDVISPSTDQVERLADDLNFEECETIRTRNAHERQIARDAVHTILHKPFPRDLFTYDEMRQLVRKFYRRGDRNISLAMNRAARAAVVA